MIRRKVKRMGKRVGAVLMAVSMALTLIPQETVNAATAKSVTESTFENPVIYADVPDIDIIRVGKNYYMVSTTMHLSPGCPIMKSTDLVNWEIVNYVYGILDDKDEESLRNGKSMYGNGQWAAGLQYHDGKYYVVFNSNTTHTSYIFSTDDIEEGSWKRTDLHGAYHDVTLFFDDDTPYLVYGGTKISYVEMEKDLSGVKKGGKSGSLFSSAENDMEGISGGLGYEGTHVLKKDGYYYVFNICWPNGYPRIEVCHRSKTFPTTQWESKIILNANFSNYGTRAGVAQGGVIDTVDGDWYGFLFQDHGAIGRTPVLTDCTWKDGWPMLGKDGDGKTVENTMSIPVSGGKKGAIVKSDEFYNDAEHRVFEETDEEEQVVKAKSVKSEKTEVLKAVSDSDEESLVEEESSVEEEEMSTVLEEEEKLPTLSGSITSDDEDDSKGEDKDKKDYSDDEEESSEAVSEKRETVEEIESSEEESEEEESEEETTVEAKTEEGESEEATTEEETETEALTEESDELLYEEQHFEKKELADNMIEIIKNGDFESGDTDNWQVMRTEKAKIEVTEDEHATGKYSAHVYDRQTCGAGICQNISGKLTMGKKYTISGRLKYTTGPSEKRFYVTIENGDNYNWRENLVSINAKKGQWVEFSGTYTVHDKNEQFPFDEKQNYIFVETPWAASPNEENDLMDYYLDDFSITTETDDIIVNGSFEDGSKGWKGNEGAKVSIKDDEAKDGDHSIYTTDRSGTGQGPIQDISGKLKAGSTYKVEAYVKYTKGVDSQKFNVTIQNGPDYRYRTILGSATAKKGEWTKITATYVFPEDAIDDQNYIFVETPWVPNPSKDGDWVDFYVDKVSMVKEKDADEKELVASGENDYNGSDLDLVWQWNHNPNNTCWSLTDRNGWLRLTTANVTSSILKARNTLTQRTYGPTCSGKIKMDVSHMKNGDVAGLASFSYNYGYVGVKKESSGYVIQMVDASENEKKKADSPTVKAKVNVEGDQTTIYFKEDFDFAGGDKVTFFYSLDGKNWEKIGEPMQLSYELTHFMGSRFAIFNYATKSTGGYVDVDYFRVSDEITDGSQYVQEAGVKLEAPESLTGVVNTPCDVKVYLEKLENNGYKKLQASVSVPKEFSVNDVIFNENAIQGVGTYSVKDSRLTMTVTGEDVAFADETNLFATIKLTVNQYVGDEKTVSFTTDYVEVDDGRVAYDVSEATATVKLESLNTKTLAKKIGYGNPIVTQEFGADPYAIVYDGRVYVYMTADEYQYDANGNVKDNDFGYIRTLRVVSSDDMLNWTDHGEIKVAGQDGAAKWASHSWAPAIAYKQIDGKDKFFLYFANDASGIGVLEADTPVGPFKDPIGKALITRQTPGCAGVVWCFDPAVLVDDDGSAYIYFGGGLNNGQQDNPKTARVAKLGDDMISIEGEAAMIDAPCMFEDSGIFKYKGRYYYSYCSNFTAPHAKGNPGYGTICYMVSDDPMGPYTYAGEIFSNPSVWFGVGGNNHHATFVYEGKPYFIYHAQTVSKALGIEKGYRSTHIDKMSFYSDGKIKSIQGTYKGIEQLDTVNAFSRIEAETIAWNAGIKVSDCDEKGGLYPEYNKQLSSLDSGDWTSVAGVDFGKEGANVFEANVKAKKDSVIEVRIDKPDGELVGTLNVSADDKFGVASCEMANVTGVKNVFLVFVGDGDDLMNVDYFTFKKAGKPTQNPDDDKKDDKPSDEGNQGTDKPADEGNKNDKPAKVSQDTKKKHHSSHSSSSVSSAPATNTTIINEEATALSNAPVSQITVEQKTAIVEMLKAAGITVDVDAIYTQLLDGAIIFNDGSAFTADGVLILVASTGIMQDGKMVAADGRCIASLADGVKVLTMDMMLHEVHNTAETTEVEEVKENIMTETASTQNVMETSVKTQIMSTKTEHVEPIINENGTGIAPAIQVMTKQKQENAVPYMFVIMAMAAACGMTVLYRRKRK